MQYDADTPKDYLSMLEDDWRKDRLLLIRQMILDARDDLEESIAYKMLRYGKGEDVFCHLNAQKAYVGLYLGNVAKLDPSGELAAGLNVGKGCVRVRKTDDLEQIQTLIAAKAALPMSEGGGC